MTTSKDKWKSQAAREAPSTDSLSLRCNPATAYKRAQDENAARGKETFF
jgi:hypothetical protein